MARIVLCVLCLIYLLLKLLLLLLMVVMLLVSLGSPGMPIALTTTIVRFASRCSAFMSSTSPLSILGMFWGRDLRAGLTMVVVVVAMFTAARLFTMFLYSGLMWILQL